MMTAFLLTIIVLMGLSSVGQAIFLYQRNTVRDLSLVPYNIASNILLIIWATYLLGRLP